MPTMVSLAKLVTNQTETVDHHIPFLKIKPQGMLSSSFSLPHIPMALVCPFMDEEYKSSYAHTLCHICPSPPPQVIGSGGVDPTRALYTEGLCHLLCSQTSLTPPFCPGQQLLRMVPSDHLASH